MKINHCKVHEQVIAEDHSLEELRKILTKLDMRRQGASDSCIDMHEYDSRNAQSPASDYDNTGLLKSRNHNVPAYPYVRGIGQAQVMSRSTPASHLGTNDDYVLDIALLNDSLAVRQAGICVQQHRSAQHKNHRQAFDFPPKERSKPRNSPVVHSTLNGESHSHTSVFQNCDNVSAIATTSSSNISRVSPKSFNTALTNRHTENDTDSDDEDGLISQQMRHPRPPRKGKRRVVNGSSSHSRHETPTRTATTVVASQPPSSGYQSQNHSSSLSSSNSSSPVERSNPVNAVECTSSQSAAALKIANKMFTQHSAMPSTSYHPSQKNSPKNDHLTMDASASATATATIDSPQCYRSSAHLATSETATVHDVTKCSLPRYFFCCNF
ncbi:unnamed protein product [Anisakis simplex]|uniref:Uncharacterized protein n=1 Tax=Anisakis simplex TaxID=6269 RepID=A0A0M3J3T2_ANISI|nr:unnamed protein product [Anisakis simplex]